MVKSCDLGHSFSPYGPPSRQITYISKKPEAGVQLLLLNFLIVLDQSGLHGKFPLKFCPQQL